MQSKIKPRAVLFRYLKNLLLVCLAAEFPLLVYWAANLGQIRPAVAVKPLLWIFLAAWGLYTIIALILRNLDKSALLVLLILLLFFTYGQVINLLEPVFPAAGSSLTVSALVIYSVLFILGMFLIFHMKHMSRSLLSGLLIIFSLLGVFNISRILLFDPRFSANRSTDSMAVDPVLQTAENSPDVYLIILDAYAREDVLLEEFAYDNSSFLDGLRDRGFYIPECGFSNYDKTPTSVPSFLNMNYLDQMGIPNSALDDISAYQIDLILNNQARKVFSNLGYQFVTARGYGAFDDIQDADIYINYYHEQGIPDQLAERNFLVLFSKTTLLRAFFETRSSDAPLVEPNGVSGSAPIDTSGLGYEEANFWYHQTNLIFDTVEQLPTQPGNYFVYAHVNSPHIPYVFASDGSFSFITDYTNDKEYYTDAVIHINSQVLQLVDSLLETSEVPPVIIIQADHSAQFFEPGVQKHKIFAAYYLPGKIDIPAYETITPVNSLRLVLHNYFDPSIELLPDFLYVNVGDGYQKVPASCGL